MDSDTQFTAFVRRQRRPAPIDDAIYWDKKRDEWLDALDHLYEQVGEFLRVYIVAGDISLRESITDINEENLGAYAAKRLTIGIGVQEITLTPIGTRLIGSKGRVDVEGSADSSRLVLIDEDIRDVHGMVSADVKIGASDDRFATSPSTVEVPTRREIAWAWRIVSRPPALQFVALNKESFFDMLMEVSNG